MYNKRYVIGILMLSISSNIKEEAEEIFQNQN